MKVTQEQIENIKQLREEGISQNAIAKSIGVNKAYVNRVCQKLVQDEVDKIFEINGLGFAENLPVTKPVTETVKPRLMDGNSSSEVYYLKKQIQDLEDRLRELKQEHASERMNHEALKKEHLLLQVDHRSIEERHKLELERKDNLIQNSGKSSLNGIIDPIIGPFAKNEKFMEAFGTGLVKVIEAKFMGGSQPALAGNAHPEASDPEVQKMLAELPQAFNLMPKANLTRLYEMVSIWLHPNFPGLLEKTHAELTAFVSKKSEQTA
jgi:transcriptional regulator with XRE-family HTH domain